MSGPRDPADGARLVFPALSRIYRIGGTIGQAALRIGFGLAMVTHGLPKLLGVPHGSMADPMAGSTRLIGEVLHLPGAPILAMVVALLETFGGLMLAAGLLTRVVAPMFAVQMAAICLALAPVFPWIDRGIEYPLILGLIAFHLSMQGGGPLSIDRLIGREL
jgi:putative oxidoreductase